MNALDSFQSWAVPISVILISAAFGVFTGLCSSFALPAIKKITGRLPRAFQMTVMSSAMVSLMAISICAMNYGLTFASVALLGESRALNPGIATLCMGAWFAPQWIWLRSIRKSQHRLDDI